MTGILELLTTFHGRIGRQQWWVGFVITLVASIAGMLLLNPDRFTAEGRSPALSWPDTLWQLALLLPGTAITVKRFNDRNWPWWLGYALAAFSAVVYLAPHFGFDIDPEAGRAGSGLFWIFFALLLATFVDNGFLRGTPGPNRYGPDPLAAPAARAA